MSEEEIGNILSKADSNNSYARPERRVFNFHIEFKNLLEVAVFCKAIHRLGLSHQIKLPRDFVREGSHDFIINNKDNTYYIPVKKLVKILLDYNIKIL